MLQNLKDIYGNKLAALDGDIGRVKDFYFDDKTWVVRYAVADTGSWLTGRSVLLSPHAFGKLDQYEKILHIKLSRQQIADSPSIESHKPVSRQFEAEYYRYYGWPAYWDGGGMWGFGGYPIVPAPTLDELSSSLHHQHRDDKHLRSTHAVTGYQIQTADGVLGHVTGFLADQRSWAIREIAVETGHWYAGKEIVIPTAKVERISYEDSTVFVSLTKSDLQHTADHGLAKASV
jgi:hypothetical protein